MFRRLTKGTKIPLRFRPSIHSKALARANSAFPCGFGNVDHSAVSVREFSTRSERRGGSWIKRGGWKQKYDKKLNQRWNQDMRKSNGSIEVIMRLVQDHVEEFDPINLNTALHKFAIFFWRNPKASRIFLSSEYFNRLIEQIDDKFSDLIPRQVEIVADSLAKLDLASAPLVTKITNRVIEEPIKFTGSQISSIFHNLVRLSPNGIPSAFIDQVCAYIGAYTDRFSAPSIVWICHGLTKLARHDPIIRDRLTHENHPALQNLAQNTAERLSHEPEPKLLGILAIALQNLNVVNEELADAFLDRLLSQDMDSENNKSKLNNESLISIFRVCVAKSTDVEKVYQILDRYTDNFFPPKPGSDFEDSDSTLYKLVDSLGQLARQPQKFRHKNKLLYEYLVQYADRNPDKIQTYVRLALIRAAAEMEKSSDSDDKIAIDTGDENAADSHHISKMNLDRIRKLCEQPFTQPPLTEIDTSRLGSLLWCLASLKINDSKLNTEIADILHFRLRYEQVNVRLLDHLSVMTWAFAQLDYHHEAFFNDASSVVFDNMHHIAPRKLVTIANAYAKLNYFDQRFFDKVADELSSQFSDLNGHELSLLPWAFSKLDFFPQEFFIKYASVLPNRVNEMTSLGLTNTLIGCAKFCAHYSKADGDNETDAHLQHVRQVFWHVAHHLERNPDILSQFDPRYMSTLVWAYATARVRNIPFLHKLAVHSVARIPEFDAQGISNLIWGFATLQLVHDNLCSAVSTFIVENMSDFIGQGLVNVIWALAKLGLPNDQFHPVLHSIADYVSSNQSNLDLEDSHIARLIWSFAISECFPQSIFPGLLKNYLDCIDELDSNSHALGLIYQTSIILKMIQPDFSEQYLQMDPSTILSAYPDLKQGNPRPSSAQEKVHEILEKLGLSPKSEDFFVLGYSCDSILSEPKIAVEFDGPYHFVTNLDQLDRDLEQKYLDIDDIEVYKVACEAQDPVLPTRSNSNGLKYARHSYMKHRYIRSKDWKLLTIPFYEWQRLADDREKEEYLKQRILSLDPGLSLSTVAE